MKHVICTALVILGLIFQPFALARADFFSGSNTDNTMQMGQATASVTILAAQSNSMDMTADDAPMPCHEQTMVDAGMENCDDCCNGGCAMKAHCTSTSLASPAILQLDHGLPELDSTKLSARVLSAHAAATPYFIYHPPKHS